jgi:acyl-coenzyme A synthetase/AMP-(fatty) acid ligase
VLFQHPAVAGCAVAPVPDEIRGEEVAACIVAAPGSEPGPALAEEIFRFCGERLAYYKVPAWYLFMEALPMTPSQKIQRGEVKRIAAGRVARGDAIDLRDGKRRPAKVT